MAFRGYLERPFCFAMYRKDQPGELLGYAGAARQQYRSEAEFYEAEFYVKKSERRQGYAGEALRVVCREVLSGGLAAQLALGELRATTREDNLPARALLKKCGFTKPADGPVSAFTLLIDA